MQEQAHEKSCREEQQEGNKVLSSSHGHTWGSPHLAKQMSIHQAIGIIFIYLFILLLEDFLRGKGNISLLLCALA